MRILHVVPTYYPAVRYGGPIRSVHGLCRALAALGHEVHVYTTSVDGPQDLAVPLGQPVNVDGVKVWYFSSRRLRRLYWSPSMGRALVSCVAGFDFVHLHSIYLWPTWAAARAAERAGVPYAVSPRGMLVKSLVKRKSRWLKTAWLRFVERHTLERAAFLHVTSALEAEEAAHFGFAIASVVVVPNGVDDDLVPPDDGAESATMAGLPVGKRLLFLGRINWKKGLDRLIPALAYAPGAHLVVVGNDEENYRMVLEALAERHGVLARVMFPGPAQGREKLALLRDASLLVLPSYSENFGNVVLEAMAAGCPVAVTKEVGLADVVHSSGAGMVVPGEPQALGNALADLLARPEQLKAMGKRGRKIVAEQFAWPALARKMEAAYCAALGKR